MAKPDKAELKNQAILLKETIAQGRKKTLNFALLQGKDQMFLITHLKKNPMMLRKEAKKEGGGPKGVTGTFNVEGKNLIFSVEEEPPGPFPKLTKKHFMTRGIAIRVTFKLPNGAIIDDGEEDEEDGAVSAPPSDDAHQDPDDGGASYADSIMGFFGDLKSDLDEKMDKASDDAKSAFQDLSDKFHASHAGQQYDDAQKHLDAIRKKIEDFADVVEEKTEEIADGILHTAEEIYDDVMGLSGDAQKKIDNIIAIGLTEAEIRQKTAEENIKKLIDNVLSSVVEAKDHVAEFTKPVTDKINELIAKYQKVEAAKEKLKDMDLSDEQANDLAVMSLENPKSFEMALKTLKTMDAKFGDLKATTAGITALQKKVQEADAAADIEKDKQKALDAKMDVATKERDDAIAAETKAKTETDKVEAALKQLKAKLPKDLSKLTPVQKAALVKVIELLKTKKAALKTASDDLSAKQTVLTDAFNASTAQYPITAAAKTKEDDAKKLVRNAEIKKKMLDSLSGGVLSPNAADPMSDEDIATMLSAVNADPEFGTKALGLLETTRDKGNLVKGTGMLVDGMANEFKDSSGNAFGDPESRAEYAASALNMGNALGGSYFDDMKAYVDKGGLNSPTTLNSGGSSYKAIEQERAKYVGAAMVGADGKIDTKSTQATDALDLVNFHPDMLFNSTPGMSMHFAKMAKTMDDPAHKQKCQDVLDGITDAPTDPAGKDLIAKATGKLPADVNADDVKSSVMSAMFTPLDQGPVGSCFATGPARNVRGNDPARVMSDMAQIATKGTFTTAQGLDIKAVRTNLGTTPADLKKNKLPPDDNPLMRSWEYTIATAGAQLADSVERKILNTQLWTTSDKRDPDGKNLNALEGVIGTDDWDDDVKNDLKNIIADQLVFRYNATSKIKESADGKSVKGNFEIFNKGGVSGTAGAITSKSDFIKIMTALAVSAAGAEGNAELKQKIADHVGSDAFINSVCLWKKGEGDKPDEFRFPWEMRGGGFDAPMVKVLNGGDPQTTDIVPDNADEGKAGHQSQEMRTKKVVSALITNFVSQDPDVDMVNISTGGIHAFEGLPNHPSLDKLKEGDDPAAAMQKHLIEPGLALAAKKLDEKTVGIMFDRQIDSFDERWLKGSGQLKNDEKGMELIAAARTKRPETDMTAKDVKAIIDAALQPLLDYQTKFSADKWKEKQVADGKTPSDDEYAKELKKRVDWAEDSKEKEFSNNAINALGSPEFVVADSNWGNESGHTFFVVIPDPVTGQPKMYERQDPSGVLTPMGDKWLDTSWEVTT